MLIAPETFHEALIECIKAAGGTKVIAAQLWPAKAARNLDDARRYLTACLDPERAEKLSLDELLMVLRAAREKGCHVGLEFLAAELGYAPPQPIQPQDEADHLRRQFIQSTHALARLVDRIAMLDPKQP